MPTSLLGYLSAKNPQLTRCFSVSDNSYTVVLPRGSNSKSGSAQSWAMPRKFWEWHDFEYEVLKSMYDGLLYRTLQQSFDELQYFRVPKVPYCQIHDENSLDSLIIKWNQSVTSTALSVAQKSLDIEDTEHIYMCRGGQAKSLGNLRPDWAAVKHSTIDVEAEDRASNLLAGDTKLGSKWSSDDIVPGSIDKITVTKEWYKPMSQIYTYCVRIGARYGYPITDKELVVIRVSPNADPQDFRVHLPLKVQPPQSEPKARPRRSTRGAEEVDKVEGFALESGYVEYKAIPWSRHQRDTTEDSSLMTVNLALWWLHMMAANDGSIKKEYGPLKDLKWQTDTDSETQSSAFTAPESSQDSQRRQPFAPKRSNLRMNLPTRSPEWGIAGSKRARRDEEEGDQASNGRAHKTAKYEE